jgi:adenine-specific DNA-methyltransferase
MSTINLHNVECLEFMKGMEDNSVDAIVTDPPYFGVKDDDWDNQWKNADHFIEWIGELSEHWQRILKPNGSLYCFASPKMAARVEVKIGEFFNVLQSVIWAKPRGGCGFLPGRADQDAQRCFFPWTERIVFAEQFAANEAMTFADYELNGQVFAGLKQWFRDKAKLAGITNDKFNTSLGFASNGGGVASGVIGDKIQFAMPTAEVYAKMRTAFPVFDREYEELRTQYEELRRPFNVTPDVPYTDVWTFRTVQAYEGKHVCEKPLALMEHIILASTRPDALVFDPFAGSGSTGIAAVLNGRRFLGCEKDPAHYRNALQRIKKAQSEPRLFAPDPVQINVQTTIEDAE